ncbi:sigma 54-interacting transcriptional regulator [Candidatus Sulfurimonas marisnigri]|uniref:Sigma 54-interacting transcriptional regulator n=1 Tax=Candidatus Sulfurimonas marisnigri TaxID=2740405 RepID=A0A7S7LYU2_9BACT|nr:sigma 54-interacting transcriptional regulator [Candidatus Sulfurimonas marisnigri]QOY53795.1 sigma 54-interacting transcriptional regulator [Candidatus Sulfurimonas marisnigri]
MKKSCETCLTHKELLVIYDIASLISDSRDIQKSLEKSLMALKNSLDLGNCVIYKLEDEMLHIFASIGFNKHQKAISEYKLGEGATGLAAKSMEPVVIENIHNDIIFLNKSGNKNSETISYIAVPLIAENNIVGVIGANLTKNTRIDFDATVRALSIVSSLFAQYISSNMAVELEKERLKDLKQYYKMEWDSKVHNFGDIIGDSKEMQNMYKVIDRIAGSDVTILVRGETGTGKELVASAIHKRSKREEEPFIKLNCAAITDSLLESELFGHEKGAFTDAKETRKGRFELADGGTLFLDEIGDISASAQVKLLRVLQEREFERVGGSKTIHVNVRLVAATNRDLEQMVKDGEFREDLYYRLNVIPIDLPPLRKRGNDIKLLVNFFLQRSMQNHKKNVVITDEAMANLMAYPWPGNVRELENTIERIVLMGSEDGITASEMSLLLPALGNDRVVTSSDSFSLDNKTLDEVEEEALISALKKTEYNQAEAAKVLGITQRQIGYKVKKYGI